MIFFVRGKRGNMLPEGLHGGIVVLHGGGIIRQQLCQPIRLQRAFRILAAGKEAGNFHSGLRDGSRLVHAQHVHSCQCLDALHIVQEHPPFGQTYGA